MPLREIQTVTINLFGTELTVEVDPMHVVHVLLALTLGLTVGNFFDCLAKR